FIPTGACGIVCNAGAAATTDDQGAGLDCSGAGTATIDGMTATACVRADFGTIFNPTDVVIRARVGDKACAVGCSVGASNGCTMGGTFRVYTATTLASYTYINTFSSEMSWTDVVVPLGAPARYVMVCRTGYGDYVRDVEVDVIRSQTCP